MSSRPQSDFPNVIYTGAVKDLSGYGAAARDYIRALDKVGVNVSADARVFENQNQGILEQVIERRLWTLLGKPTEGPIQILHLTPDNYGQYRGNKRIKIGYYAWETSKLPQAWVHKCNDICQEVWVPCQYLKDASIRSGVTIPIEVVPHVIPVKSKVKPPTCVIDQLPDNVFKFYSIFQWSERKNPLATLAAYYQEFSRRDPVIFILKTYWSVNNPSQRDVIRREISKLRKITRGIDCPPILLIESFLGENEIQALHYYGDCYVSMARSEGFGIPAFEAAASGNPIIVPNYSAFPEFFDEDTAYLVDVPKEVPVTNMSHISILYTGDMLWGDPSITSCRRKMRNVFEHQEVAKAVGENAQKYISQNLSYKKIGQLMKNHLERIAREL